MQEILVKTLSGKTRVFGMDKKDNVLQLKKQIFDNEGIPIDKQCLMFHTRYLKDEKKYRRILLYQIVGKMILKAQCHLHCKHQLALTVNMPPFTADPLIHYIAS